MPQWCGLLVTWHTVFWLLLLLLRLLLLSFLTLLVLLFGILSLLSSTGQVLVQVIEQECQELLSVTLIEARELGDLLADCLLEALWSDNAHVGV